MFCTDCGGRAYISTPREDIDVGELGRAWALAIARYSDSSDSLPGPIAALKQQAQ